MGVDDYLRKLFEHALFLLEIYFGDSLKEPCITANRKDKRHTGDGH